MTRIEVLRSSFWSPESPDPLGWLAHWSRDSAARCDAEPPVDRIPPIQRRRMSRLSKMAMAVALDAAGDEPLDYSIFCSRHGEIVRTRSIMDALVARQEVSPAAFAQSVHNTSSGLYTILAGSQAASTSIASGANTFACAWLEAVGWLAENPSHVILLVDFDEVIPAEYRPYSDSIHCDHALALVLRAADGNGISFSADTARPESPLPLGPQFLAWLQGDARELGLAADGQSWRWAR